MFLRGLIVSLILLNASLLFLHFYEAKAEQVEQYEQFRYNQEIEVKIQQNELVVTHHFTNLPNERIEIQWPKKSESRTCEEKENANCNRLNDGKTAFIEGDSATQSIVYRIPYHESDVYLPAIFAALKKGDVYHTILHVSQEDGKKRQVISEIKPVAYEAFEEISYYLFRGQGPVSTLYFSEQPLPIHYEGDYVTVYGKGMKKKSIQQYEEKLAALDQQHSVMIAKGKNIKDISKRMIIADPKQMKRAFDRLLANTFYARYDVGKQNDYVSHITMSFLLDEELGNKRMKKVVNTLKESFTEVELQAFLQLLQEAEGQTVREKQLDEMIGNVLQVKTSFIQKNSDPSKPFYPFMVESLDQVVIQAAQLDLSPTLIEHERFYPLLEVLQALTYDVKTNEHSLYVTGKDEHYRFPYESLFYVLNERRYNTNKLLIHEIGDELYMSEANMQSVFPITMTTEDGKILIEKTAGGSK